MQRDLGKVIAHIPARAGSQRVPRKNVRLIKGKPMLSYTVSAGVKSQYIDELYVNTDDAEMLEVGQQYGAKPYLRSPELANDKATSDDFNFDVIKNLSPDTLIMINPVCPLIETCDIDQAIEAYINSDCDTLITCSHTKMQTFCDDQPVNINIKERLAPTQDNPVVQILNWAITIWDAKKFQQRFETLGYASLGEKRLLFPIDPYKAIKVSYEEDFELILKLVK